MGPLPRRLAAALALGVALVSVGQFLHEAGAPQDDFATRYAAGVANAGGHDPYDLRLLRRIEREIAGVDFAYPFKDPPPVATLFRAITAVPYRTAQYAWSVFGMACAVACVVLTLRALRLRPADTAELALVPAVALTFAPLRNGLTLGQVDPFLSMLALVALTVLSGAAGGIVQAWATMKPQATLLASGAGFVRNALRFALGLVAGYALLIAATALLHGPSWQSWYRRTRGGGDISAVKLAIGACVLVLVCVLSLRAWRRLRASELDRRVAALAVLACANAAVMPFVFLNLHSDVLMLVPLTLLASRAAGAEALAVLGIAGGIFFVDGLFAVSYHSGLAHTILPLALAAGLAAAAWVIRPALRTPVAIALAVNVAVTLPPFAPTTYTWFSVAAATLVLAQLSRVAV